ncbi:MAG: PQQ-binding-like beta-propeller repeat protein [Verrucomicrobiota bacterium]
MLKQSKSATWKGARLQLKFVISGKLCFESRRLLALVYGLVLLGSPLPELRATPGKEIYEWRGDGSGKFLGIEPPVQWSPTENVLWKTAMSDWSNASPVILDGKIFICSEPTSLICLDLESGKVLWERTNGYLDVMELSKAEKEKIEAAKEDKEKLDEELASLQSENRKLGRILKRKPDDADAKAKRKEIVTEIKGLEEKRAALPGEPSKPKTHDANGYSSYTPVTDGESVFVANGLGIVAAYDLEGKRLWIKQMAKPDHKNWGGSTTPLLAAGKLIVRFKDAVALDPKTGEEVWRTEVAQNFGTPVVFQVEGKDMLFTNKGEILVAKTGEMLSNLELAETLAEKPWSTFNKPVVDGGVLFNAQGYNGKVGVVQAFKIPDTVSEIKDGLKKIWEAEVAKERYYSSLIVHKGKVYALGHEYTLTVLDRETGKILKSQKIDEMKGTAFPSMTLGGQYLLVSSDEGQTAVLDLDEGLKQIALNKVEKFRSCPVFIGNRMYLRASEYMYAFE